jgi:hypothetical protein
MYIPHSLVTEGVELLGQNENDILARLGREVYSLEGEQADQALIGRVAPKDLIKKGGEYLSKKSDALRKAICPEWRDKKRENLDDSSKVLIVLIGIVAEALKLSASYLNLAMVIAVIILKRGIDKFCQDSK